MDFESDELTVTNYDIYPDAKMIFVQWNQLRFLFRWCFQYGAPCEISKFSQRVLLFQLIQTAIVITKTIGIHWLKKDNSMRAILLLQLLSFHQGLTTKGSAKQWKSVILNSSVKIRFIDCKRNSYFPQSITFFVRQARKLIEELKRDEIVSLIGDGRCDSPGYSATYGTILL